MRIIIWSFLFFAPKSLNWISIKYLTVPVIWILAFLLCIKFCIGNSCTLVTNRIESCFHNIHRQQLGYLSHGSHHWRLTFLGTATQGHCGETMPVTLWRSNPRPPDEKSRAVPTELPRSLEHRIYFIAHRMCSWTVQWLSITWNDLAHNITSNFWGNKSPFWYKIWN